MANETMENVVVNEAVEAVGNTVAEKAADGLQFNTLEAFIIVGGIIVLSFLGGRASKRDNKEGGLFSKIKAKFNKSKKAVEDAAEKVEDAVEEFTEE
jgi:hypothetical protein